MEQSTVEEIMDRASELGRLIQDTDIYRTFIELSGFLKDDESASKLLDEYEERLREIDERQRAGDIIESYEMESLREISMDVQNHGLIMEFLAAKKEYISLLERIQQSLIKDSSEKE